MIIRIRKKQPPMSGRDFSEILCSASNSKYINIDSLIPEKEFSRISGSIFEFTSSLEMESKNPKKELLRELTTKELAWLTRLEFHKYYKKSPDFEKYKKLRRKGQKSENTYVRRMKSKREELKTEKTKLENEIQQYKEWIENTIASDNPQQGSRNAETEQNSETKQNYLKEKEIAEFQNFEKTNRQ